MFSLPDLPYPYSALEPYLDEETMRIHHTRHHAAYIQNLNDTLKDYGELGKKTPEALLKELDTVPEVIRAKVRNHGGGHVNHSFFWTIMAPSKSPLKDGELKKSLEKTFGSLEIFKEKFSQAALGRFGSGWAWLVKNGNGLEITDTANQDSPLSEGKTPVLGLDVWEHAYYLKYQNRRADYVKAWWNVVDWPEVERLFKS